MSATLAWSALSLHDPVSTLRAIADKHRAELNIVTLRATAAQKREDLLLRDIRREGARPMHGDRQHKDVLIWEQAELIESLQLEVELDRNNRDRTL